MRALLLGPDGQLGRDVRRAHAASGDAIELVPLPREKLDLSVPGMIERVLGGLDFDALVNCAAYTAVDGAEDDAALAFAVNAYAVQAMARVCAAKRARLLHISTDYVFGGNRAQEQATPGARPDRAGQRLRRVQGNGRDPCPPCVG